MCAWAWCCLLPMCCTDLVVWFSHNDLGLNHWICRIVQTSTSSCLNCSSSAVVHCTPFICCTWIINFWPCQPTRVRSSEYFLYWFHLPHTHTSTGHKCLCDDTLLCNINLACPVVTFPSAVLRVYTCVILRTQVRRRSGPKCWDPAFFHWPKTHFHYTLYRDTVLLSAYTQNVDFWKGFDKLRLDNVFR
jgi:hypothetical protein